MEAEPASIPEALEWLRKVFRAQAAGSLRLVYQLELSGAAGGEIWIRVDAGRLEMGEGRAPGPDVILALAARDFFGILCGRENPDLLFMVERLRIDGDLSLALKLRTLFAAPG